MYVNTCANQFFSDQLNYPNFSLNLLLFYASYQLQVVVKEKESRNWRKLFSCHISLILDLLGVLSLVSGGREL